jgi:hypothetical protein
MFGMPAKITEYATEYEEVDRWDGGVGWIAHPDEFMQRASHTLKTDDGVWLIDPIDAEGVDELVAEYGEVAGVVLLSNYHTRDADVFADRHGVSVYLPEAMEGIEEDIDATVERVAVGDTFGGYELLEVARRGSLWQEYALARRSSSPSRSEPLRTSVSAVSVSVSLRFCASHRRGRRSVTYSLTACLRGTARV